MLLNLLRRIKNIFLGKASQGVSAMERNNKAALLEQAREDIRTLAQEQQAALATHAAQKIRLERDVEDLKRGVGKYESLTERFMQSGKTEEAKKAAFELQTKEEALKRTEEELHLAEKSYEQSVRMIKVRLDQAESTLKQIENDIKSEERDRAFAEIAEINSGLSSKAGSVSDRLTRLQSMAKEDADKAKGRIMAANDMVQTTVADNYEAEQGALQDAALASFLAKRGKAVEKPTTITNNPAPLETEGKPGM